ncbi:hypothetical protein RV10_GL001972 [Enterococcus pallens]|nr:hypothetical protein RV10_GL001972 [Enterococcus pallens]
MVAFADKLDSYLMFHLSANLFNRLGNISEIGNEMAKPKTTDSSKYLKN